MITCFGRIKDMADKRDGAHCLLIQEAIRSGWAGVEEFLAKVVSHEPTMASVKREELLQNSLDFFGDRVVTDERVLATVILKCDELGRDWIATKMNLLPVFGEALTTRLVCKAEDMVLRKLTEQQRFVPRAPRGERRGWR